MRTRFLFICLVALLAIPAAAQPVTTTISLKKLGQWTSAREKEVLGQKYSSLWGWASPQGREYAILGGTDSIFFVDVTVPATPVLCDVEAGGAKLCTNREFKTHAHYCYAAADKCDNPKLQIFDLQYLPDSVHKVYEADTVSGNGHSLFVDNDRLYVGSNGLMAKVGSIRVRELHAMTVLSLANPERPVILNHIDGFDGTRKLFSEVHDMYVRHDTAYCSAGTDGLFIYDLRAVKSPRLIQSIVPPYPQSGYNHSSWLSEDGNLMVFTDETHGTEMKLVDMRDFRTGKSAPEYFFLKTVGEKSELGTVPHNAFIKDSLVYVSYYQEGVVVYDVHKPKSPVKLGQYDTYPQNDSIADPAKRYNGLIGCWNVYPFFSSGTIIASDMRNGLFTLKLDTFVGINRSQVPVRGIELTGTLWQNDIHLKTDLEAPADLQITLTDMAGRTLWAERRYVESGPAILKVQPDAAANGWYLLQVRTQAGSRTFRVLRQP